jgi:hypothetical protein
MGGFQAFPGSWRGGWIVTRTCIQSNFDKGGITRDAPVHKIIPLNVAYSACETTQKAQETSRLWPSFRFRLPRLSK